MFRYTLFVLSLLTIAWCADDIDLSDLLKAIFNGTETNTESNAKAVDARASEQVERCDEGQECVLYYLCNETTIITSGESLIDIRANDALGCDSYLEVCCALESQSVQSLVKTEPAPEFCGYRNINGVGFKITGNEHNESQFGEFPWMVAILKYDKLQNKTLNIYQCGGSLIHPSVVLTAAHCVASKPAHVLGVRAGEWDTQTTGELFPHQNRNVERVILHEDYHRGALFNDIALLFVSEPFEFNEIVQPVCLPPPDQNFDLELCYATGWGKNKFEKGGEYQVILKRIGITVIEHDKCQEELRNTRLGKHFVLDDSFLCAGGGAGMDTCKGDGGSPLVCPIPGKKDRYYQAGIVAWGIGCGSGSPAAYASVSYLRSWIDKKLSAENIDSTYYTP